MVERELRTAGGGIVVQRLSSEPGSNGQRPDGRQGRAAAGGGAAIQRLFEDDQLARGGVGPNGLQTVNA